MQKIASPRELQAELKAIMAFVHASEKPDRQVVASKLRALADRVAGASKRDLEKLVERLDEFLYPSSRRDKRTPSRGDIPGREHRLLMDWYQEASDYGKADDKMRKQLLADLSGVARTLDRVEKDLGK